MLGQLKAYAWQAATAGALLLCLGLAMTVALDKHDLANLRADYATQGATLVRAQADLTTCRGGRATLEAEIRDTNARINAQSAESARRLKESSEALVGTLARLKRAQAAPAPKPLTGADQCQRLLEVADHLQDQVK